MIALEVPRSLQPRSPDLEPSALKRTPGAHEGTALPELRLTLLGAPQITLGGSPLAFTRRKAVALLAYLAVTGRPHSRAALASLLAAEAADDEQAKTQLRNTLYALSSSISPYLVLTRGTIALDPTRAVWVDMLALQRAVVAAGAPGAEIAPLAQAVAFFAGDFLAGFAIQEAPAFEEWLVWERQRVHGLLVQALEMLLMHSSAQGDDAGVLEWATRLLEAAPWREEGHRQLIRVLARTGQRAAALAQYETCRRVLAEQLHRPPEAATAELGARLQAAAAEPPHNVPLPTAVSVGRTAKLAALRQRLEDPSCRLVTVVGLGGSGKTHLAVRAAGHYVHSPASSFLLDGSPFPDGVVVVRLPGPRAHAPQLSAAEITRRIALAFSRVMGLGQDQSEVPAARVLAWLRSKRLLLIVDHGEQLASGGEFVGTIMRQAPGVTVLVTSRMRLHLQDEVVVELGGLDLPRDAADLERAAASQLFVQQVQQLGVLDPLTMDDRTAIVHICQMTQGLPLALMLAARWRRGLSYSAIADELARGLDLLMTTDRAIPERHRSVRAVLEATWDTLTEGEQATLRRLSVCREGCTLEAAQAIAGAGPAQMRAPLERAILGWGDLQRVVLHPLAQQYAAEQLAGRPEEEQQVRARHAAYFGGLLAQHATALVQMPQAREALGREMANVRTAWEWAVATRDVALQRRMRGGLAAWYEVGGALEEWRQLVEPAADELRKELAAGQGAGGATAGDLCYLLVDEARGHLEEGHDGRALAILQEAEVLAQQSRLLHLEACTAHYRGALLARQGSVEGARQQLQHALAVARTAGVPGIEGRTLWQLGRLCAALAEYPLAQDYYGGALRIYHTLGDQVGEATVTCDLGRLSYEQGHMAVARTSFEDSLRVHRLLGHRAGEQAAVHGLSLVLDDGWGFYTEADDYAAQDLALAQELGDRRSHARALTGQGRHALRLGDLAQARAAFTQALTLSQECEAEENAALARWGLGLVAHYEGHETHAYAQAQQAVAIAHERRQRRTERLASRLLGHALAGLGLPMQATIVYQRVLELDRALGYQHLAVETTADLARMALAQGDTERAQALASTVATHLEDHGVTGAEEPVLLYLTCYRALGGHHHRRAERLLAAGIALLHGWAAQFEDAERRRMFLEDLPAHNALRHLWRHGDVGDAWPGMALASQESGRPTTLPALRVGAGAGLVTGAGMASAAGATCAGR